MSLGDCLTFSSPFNDQVESSKNEVAWFTIQPSTLMNNPMKGKRYISSVEHTNIIAIDDCDFYVIDLYLTLGNIFTPQEVKYTATCGLQYAPPL
jgi:hypothetical protein